jgi:hypothetical protein
MQYSNLVRQREILNASLTKKDANGQLIDVADESAAVIKKILSSNAAVTREEFGNLNAQAIADLKALQQ